MPETTRVIAKIPISKPATRPGGQHVLEIAVSYDKGNGYDRPRGYYLAVCPVEQGSTANGGWTAFSMASGATALLEEAVRFSPRRLAVIEVKQDLLDGLVAKVLARNGVSLEGV